MDKNNTLSVLVYFSVIVVMSLLLSIYLYVTKKENSKNSETDFNSKTFAKLIAGYSSILNGIVHIILSLYMFKDKNFSKGESILGIIFLAILNLSLGILIVTNKIGPSIPLLWYIFVIIGGIMIPAVWQKFFNEGLMKWPLIPIIIWMLIFAFEYIGFFMAATWYMIK